MQRMVVVRHGETTGDVEGRYGGAYDDVLSATGEAQVRALSEALAGMGITRIFSSPLSRARQTAKGLGTAVGVPVQVVAGLQERDQYGALTGMTKVAARVEHPDLVALVQDRLNTLPGAESYAEFSARVRMAWADVVAVGEPCAAVVWHGGGMRVLFREILALGELQSIGDCCWVELQRTGPEALWQVQRLEGMALADTNVMAH